MLIRSALPMSLSSTLCVVALMSSLVPPAPSPRPMNQAPAKRVLLGAPIVSGYITIDEGRKNIVGISRVAERGAAGFGWLLEDIYPQDSKPEIIGASVKLNVEEALRLEPDAIFLSPGDSEIWRRIGALHVIELSFKGNAIADSKASIWLSMGSIAGKSDRAQRLLKRLEDRLHIIRARISFAKKITNVRVISMHQAANDRWIVDGRFNDLNVKFGDAEGVSVAGVRTAELNIEELFREDPDVLLITGELSDSDFHDLIKTVTDNSPFQVLHAVQDHRVYLTPFFTFLNEAAEYPILLDWLVEVFHPEAMPCHLRDDIRRTYEDVYNYSISEDEIDRAIWMKENRSASGYERFARASGASFCTRTN